MSTPSEAPATARTTKPGRPPIKREVDKAAEELRRKHLLPEPPGKQVTWDQMQEYFALLSIEMWAHVTVYLYRIKPRILRQLKDPEAPNYIDCLSEPFTMEYMIERHGGGKYMLEVTNPDRGSRAVPSTHLFRCYFEVDMVRHKPKLAYEELDINHRENMSYIQMLQHDGILDNKGRPMQNQQQNGGNGTTGVNTDFLKEILGFVSKMNADQQAQLREKIAPGTDPLTKSIGEILVERMRQDDPGKQLATIQTIMQSFKEMNRGSDMSPIFEKMMEMQSQHNATVLGLFKEMAALRNQPPAATGPLSQVKEVLEIAESLTSLRGGGGGGRRSGWDIGLDYVREAGMPVLSLLNNMFSARRGGPVSPIITPPPANGTAPAGAFDPYANPGAMRAHSAAIAGQQQPPPIAPAAGGTPQPVPNDLLAAFQQYGALLVNALNNGTTGFDFADSICLLAGNGVHAMFAAQGEMNLVQAAMQVPEIALFGMPRVQTFVHQFVHYQEFLDQEQGTEELEKA